MRRILIILFSLSLQLIDASGQIIHVPSEYPTIQQGINAATEGDTVLVSPGTYYENISLAGDNITLASFFLTTGDTSYISSTIIDGSQNGTVITVDMGEDTTTRICGFSLTNGNGGYRGGGISIDESDPSLDHLYIYGNRAANGGGVSLQASNSIISHLRIVDNSAEKINNYMVSGGGGVYIRSYETIIIKNTVIAYNSTIEGGGGINSAYSMVSLESVDIIGNTAGYGGGIYGGGNELTMDSLNRCNIYLNRAKSKNDIHNGYGRIMNVYVDTFSVFNPNDFHVGDTSRFEFDILNAKLTQVNADLFISPAGDDNNTGLSSEDPLKTIHTAFSKMLPFSGDTNTIYLAAGIYSPSATHEFFPVNLMDYILLEGDDVNTTILDAEGMGSVIYIYDNMFNSVSDMTITGGHAEEGAGIYCYKTDATIRDLNILDNEAEEGGGIYAYWCHPTISDCNIQDNTATLRGGGISLGTDSWSWDSPHLTNLVIRDNFAGSGGGIATDAYVTPVFKGLTICHNAAGTGGGISTGVYEDLTFDPVDRCNIYLNSAAVGNDLYSSRPIDVIVDTFTVMSPTEFHASILEKFSFDILNAKLNQVDDDLYISPEGDNTNSGLTADEPLKTIHHALTILLASESDQRQIHLLDGIYSPVTNGEFFPVALPDYMHISGTADSLVILDADSSARVMQIIENDTNHVSDMTLKRGLSESGAGLYIKNSDPHLEHMIITSNSAGNGGGMSCQDSDPRINDLIITGNNANYAGGLQLHLSTPVFQNVILSNNTAGNSGGGISITQSGSKIVFDQVTVINNQANNGAGIYNLGFLELNDCLISGNSGDQNGGGIFSSDSLWVFNTNLINNTSGSGGGLYVDADSFALLDTVDLSENSAGGGGGLVCGGGSYISLNVVNVSNNTCQGRGGGIYCATSNLYLKSSSIVYNYAGDYGGGLYCDNYISPKFDSLVRCNIYLNHAGYANDIMALDTLNVIVDTFTVIHPTDYHAYNLKTLRFDILNFKVSQADTDVYVSPGGNDNNSGLTSEEPLKTIDRALLILRSDSAHQHTIHLANGVYSPSSNGERFPVQMSNYSSMVGESRDLTILDAEDSSQVIHLIYDTVPVIKNLTIKGGNHYIGAGIGSYGSIFDLYNLRITSNHCSYYGGGINLSSGSKVNLANLVIENNSAEEGGGINAFYSELELNNVDFISNSAVTGAGIYLENSDTVMMENINFMGNSSIEYGGGIYSTGTDLILTNAEFDSNEATRGAGIWAESASIEVRNSLLTRNIAANGYGSAVNIYNHQSPYGDYELKFINSTFTENSYPALYLYSGDTRLINDIIWNNEGPYQVYYLVTVSRDDTLTVSNSDIQDGKEGIFDAGPAIIDWLSGNIEEDPQFLFSGDYPYSLDAGSPCIDAGTPDTTGLFLPYNDLIGNTRVWDGDGDGVPVIDIGPYEYGAPVTVNENTNKSQLLSSGIVIFPNPAKDQLSILFSNDPDIRKVILLNSQGQVVKTIIIPAAIEKLVMSTGEFNQGIYSLMFSKESGIYETKKVLIID